MRFDDESKEEPKKKTNFLLAAGEDSSWNVNCLPTYEEKEIKPDLSL